MLFLKNYKFKLWKTSFTKLKHKPQKNILTKYIYDKGLCSKYTKYLEQTTSLKAYKSEHLAKEKIHIVNQHIKNTQNHISLGNYNLKQQWSSTAHLLDPVSSKKGEGGEGLLWWLSGKESACNAGDRVWPLGWEDLPEKGMATHSSTLA